MMIKLKSVAKLCNDKKKLEDDDIWHYVSTENLEPNRSGVHFPVTSLPKAKNIHVYSKGDVLVSNIRPYFKKIWMANFDGTRSGDILCFKSTSDELLQEYLYVVLQSDKFFDYVTKSSKGTKMPRGDKNAIMDYEFELPSLDIQRDRIKQILSIEHKIDLNNKLNDNLMA